jgi:hypothetical protein
MAKVNVGPSPNFMQQMPMAKKKKKKNIFANKPKQPIQSGGSRLAQIFNKFQPPPMQQ